MARNEDLARAGGAALAAAMGRKRTSTTALAEESGVGVSSISAYLRGETLPNRMNAFAIAEALDAPEVLVAWGRPDLASALKPGEVEAPSHGDRVVPRYDYRIERDSDVPFRRVGLGHEITAVVIAITDTSHGTSYLMRSDTGTLFEVRPVYSMEAFFPDRPNWPAEDHTNTHQTP